jgi:hypothetical protein
MQNFQPHNINTEADMKWDINNINSKTAKKKPAPIKLVASATTKEPKDLLQAFGYVNGHKELLVFDTGAVCSVISEKVV